MSTVERGAERPAVEVGCPGTTAEAAAPVKAEVVELVCAPPVLTTWPGGAAEAVAPVEVELAVGVDCAADAVSALDGKPTEAGAG